MLEGAFGPPSHHSCTTVIRMAAPQKVSKRINPLREKCGQKLRELRENKGYSLREMAKVLGVKRHSFIALVELGYNRIPPDQVSDWADVLGVTPRELTILILRYYSPNEFEILFENDPDIIDESRFFAALQVGAAKEAA